MVTKKAAPKRKAPVRKKTAVKKAPAKNLKTITSKKTITRGPNGGARKGSGRKIGSATKRTRAIADKLAESSDITPLEYMMKTLNSTDENLKAQHKKGEIDTETYLVRLKFNMDRRDQAAKDAAPYIHPRLSSITAEVKGSEHDQWIAAMAKAGI